MSSSLYVEIQRPRDLQPDSVIVSYLKAIAAAGPQSVRQKQKDNPQKYRLASQFDPDIIDTILKYAKEDDPNICHLVSCDQRVHMTDTLRNFKACAVCRAKAALHSQDYRASKTPARKSRGITKKAKKVRIRLTLA